MAEVGLVRFAHVARAVAETVLPTYRSTYSKYSKRLFPQPSLLAILCLMREEDWTFREAEVRLGEHQELRAALGLERVPDDTTRSRFLRRVDPEVVRHALSAAGARQERVCRRPVWTAWSGRSTRRAWPPPRRVALSWTARAIGAWSAHGSTGRRGWTPSLGGGASCWGSSPMLGLQMPRRSYVRSSIWHSRAGK
jgi:hypothetical protein